MNMIEYYKLIQGWAFVISYNLIFMIGILSTVAFIWDNFLCPAHSAIRKWLGKLFEKVRRRRNAEKEKNNKHH